MKQAHPAEPYLGLIWATVDRVAGHLQPADREDLHGELFFTLLHALRTYRPNRRATLTTWIITCLRWGAFRALNGSGCKSDGPKRKLWLKRRYAIEHAASLDEQNEEGLCLRDLLIDDGPSPHYHAESNDSAERLWAAVADLPELEAVAVAMAYGEDAPWAPVAARIGQSMTSAKRHATRGIERLREQLSAEEWL